MTLYFATLLIQYALQFVVICVAVWYAYSAGEKSANRSWKLERFENATTITTSDGEELICIARRTAQVRRIK